MKHVIVMQAGRGMIALGKFVLLIAQRTAIATAKASAFATRVGLARIAPSGNPSQCQHSVQCTVCVNA